MIAGGLDAAAVLAARDVALAGDGAAGAATELVWPEPLLPSSTGSTNDDLAALVSAPSLQLLATSDQQGGHGRLDRVWEAPAGAALAMSVLFRPGPQVPPAAFGWLTVLTAVVAARTIDELAQAPSGERLAAVKWPNDLLLRGAKVAGILARFLPSETGTGHRVVVGLGLNLHQRPEELPVRTATSLAIEGLNVDASELAGRLWARLGSDVEAFLGAGGDVDAPLPGFPEGLLAAARKHSSTLGNEVRVHLPGGAELVGTAVDLDGDGCLIVAEANGERHHIHAGDVVHLRRSDGGYA